MSQLELKSVTVQLRSRDKSGFESMASLIVSCTPQEAFTLLSMPCLSGLVLNLVPEYGLPSMPDTENKE